MNPEVIVERQEAALRRIMAYLNSNPFLPADVVDDLEQMVEEGLAIRGGGSGGDPVPPAH